ncbi:hypothetical protein [Shewanella halifaxensis]|uniref:hypothetical protein n=1 Tax=Shewanella halifaxensis TaxID=271098 RepID=UPI0002DF328F|nr:hypothetical protein [Shewanella halifaxensis]
MRINNFVGAAGVIQEGIAVVPLLAECELEAHDLYQAQLDCLPLLAPMGDSIPRLWSGVA